VTTETFSIPTFKKQAIQARLDKLVKKAARYGNTDIGYSFGEKSIRKIQTEYGPTLIEYIEINVYGEAPQIEGWQLVARVEIINEENLVHTVPGVNSGLQNNYRHHNGHCDHCNTLRARNDVYVLTDGETEMAVGRTCLRDFLGIDNPKAIVNRAQFYEELRALDEDELEGFGGFGMFFLKDILSVSAAYIRKAGYVSRARSGELGLEPTGDCVKSNLSGARLYSIDVIDEDRAWAEKTIEYFRGQDQFDTDYLNNIRVLMKTDMIATKHVGLVASAVITAQRALAPAVEKKVSNYVGEIKQRLKGMQLIIDRIIYLGCGHYGHSYLHLFKDTDGNAFSWITDNKLELDEGTEVQVDATVKQHKDYKGTKQTVLTRAKIVTA
jgi:hypothetical protein